MNKPTHKEWLQHQADYYMRLVNIGLELIPTDEQVRESFSVVTKCNLQQYYKYKDLVENYDKHFSIQSK